MKASESPELTESIMNSIAPLCQGLLSMGAELPDKEARAAAWVLVESSIRSHIHRATEEALAKWRGGTR